MSSPQSIALSWLSCPVSPQSIVSPLSPQSIPPVSSSPPSPQSILSAPVSVVVTVSMPQSICRNRKKKIYIYIHIQDYDIKHYNHKREILLIVDCDIYSTAKLLVFARPWWSINPPPFKKQDSKPLLVHLDTLLFGCFHHNYECKKSMLFPRTCMSTFVADCLFCSSCAFGVSILLAVLMTYLSEILLRCLL